MQINRYSPCDHDASGRSFAHIMALKPELVSSPWGGTPRME